MMLLSVSGAIAALGDTLTIAGGISPEENAIVAMLVELRIFHPLIAIVTGALVFLAVQVTNSRRPTRETLRFGWATVGLFALQLLLGALNVILKAPVWRQMVHLLITMGIWVPLVLFGAATLAAPAAQPQSDVAASRAHHFRAEVQPDLGGATSEGRRYLDIGTLDCKLQQFCRFDSRADDDVNF